MTLIRPRITDFHDILIAQSDVDFAIPFLDEDTPLYVDPFLLWMSPSQQDQALHTSLINAFNHLNHLLKTGKRGQAIHDLVLASECDEVGLGYSGKRQGIRISEGKAAEILSLFETIPEYAKHGFRHFEEIQLYIDGISKDRVSDICCSFLKSFLIDFTIDQCEMLGIPLEVGAPCSIYDYQSHSFRNDEKVYLPVNPESREPIIFVPRRWLRFTPWINFDGYFKNYCPRDVIFNPGEPADRVKVLNFNRHNYGLVQSYVRAKVRTQEDCKADPLFQQIPVTSAKRKLSEISKLPIGRDEGADRRYEDLVSQLLASLFYPYLDFAETQSRTDSGTLIRDLVFYNNRSLDFLDEIYTDYGNRQLIMELKNVRAMDRQHISQLNRYLTTGLGNFGALVTRNRLSRAMFRNTIDLWSGQRKSIIAITDEDLSLMVNVFESKQRSPIDVLKKKYVEFRRACPG